jgi:excisionase family DNA binding protein
VEKLLKFEDVLAVLEVSDKTLRKLMREGKVKYQRVGREFRFRPSGSRHS